ncbi:MAG: RagB/SusD family nutrient uptake outer membrane protein [Reichenbachiella sp.]
MKSKNYILVVLLSVMGLLASCSEEFLDRPPKDRLVDAGFYSSDEQILAATAPLYSAVWKDYIDKSNFKLGDIRGGSLFRAWGDRDMVEFNVTAVSDASQTAYRSFYIVVGQSNLAINNINTYAGSGVSAKIKNHTLGEAHFMRATAYSHLVMNFGAVPIIENNLEHLNNPQLPRNNVEDVWRFVREDYEFAAANLTEEALSEGRLTKWSALGMLARTHLTLAGLDGSPGGRDQAHLNNAMAYADSVITMSGKSLLIDYENLFLYPYDNGNESLFELQWVYAPSGSNTSYEASNTMISQITYSNDIAANGDGWGGDLSASWWMLSLYDGLMEDDGATAGFTSDDRLKATFMLPGFTYPEITQRAKDDDGNDITQGLVFDQPGVDDTQSFASIKKYVVGNANDLDGQVEAQRYPNNTYMLRLAEMYLTYTEASLGNDATTTDAKTLAYFNAVHMRAGLQEFGDDASEVLTWDVIFEERVKEFAMESMTWYDLVRLHYYDPNEAYDIINGQDRGLFVINPDQWPNPQGWTFTKTDVDGFRNAVATSGNFLIPIPASEMSQSPSLGGEPVPYDFGE